MSLTDSQIAELPVTVRKQLDELAEKAQRGAAAVDMMAELTNANRKVREAQARFSLQKEVAKNAKADLEAAQGELSRLVSAWESDLQRPLLAQQMQSDKAPEPEAPAELADETPDDEQLEPGTGYSWPASVENATVAGLVAYGINTLAELADWASVKPIGDIPGVTPEQAEVLKDLLAAAESETGEGAEIPWNEVLVDDSGLPTRVRTAFAKLSINNMAQVLGWLEAGNQMAELEHVGEPTAKKAEAVIKTFCDEYGIENPWEESGPAAEDAPAPSNEDQAFLEELGNDELDDDLGEEFDDSDLTGEDAT